MKTDQSKLRQALERLGKWRAAFAGWQLGTRAADDPECQAVRDHREVTMFLRAELNALTGALIKKGVITAEEFNEQLMVEVVHLDLMYEKKFPGFSASSTGMIYSMPDAANTMKGWKP